MNKKTYVFVDEFGTPALDVELKGVEPYFIYVAVLISEDMLLYSLVKSISIKPETL